MLQFLIPQPALRELFVVRANARCRRLRKSITSPRRVLLSTIAVVLPIVWIINFAASMLLRERFSPESFRNGVLLIGVGYFLWYVVKACIHRPAAAIEWTPAESGLMCGGPFRRSDLIRYRLTLIFSATLLKAAFSSIMFLPELSVGVAGFLGMLLGLAFLDLARMAGEIILCGIQERTYRRVKTIVLGLAGAAATLAAVTALFTYGNQSSELPIALSLPLEFIRQLALLRETTLGHILSLPLIPFVEVITAAQFSWALLGWLSLSMCITFALIAAVIRLDAVFAQRSAEAVRRCYASIAAERRVRRVKSSRPARLPIIARLNGAGPIAWRQWLGVRKYQTGLLAALSVPAALSCLPLLKPGEAIETFLNVAGMLCLYSFLLLPSALKFDFRRDYDRLPILKSLPVRPLAVVIGQLATPVVLTTLLQIFVLAIAYLVCPVPLVIVFNALLMILPINVVIFGLDNLIYLMYPYRQSEEGLQPFVRATLTFTAKGLLFATAITAVYGWAIGCRRLRDVPFFAAWGDHRLLFVAGLWMMMVTTATVLMLLAARFFDQFDPTVDRLS